MCARWPPRWSGRLAASSIGGCVLAAVAVGNGVAHGGSVPSETSTVTVPTWLVLATGGAAVGASFLLASLVTDRELVDAIDGWRARLPGGTVLTRSSGGMVSAGGGLVAVLGLGLVIVATLFGSGQGWGTSALLLVWVGWWGGFTATTYLVGNAWPVLDPWRRLARVLPARDRGYPARLAAWPAVVGLLLLVWLEVASPLATDPHLLGLGIIGYTILTLAGASTFGRNAWFRRADPVSRLFRCYGRVAPIGIQDGRLTLGLPGARVRGVELRDRSEVLFVAALVWVTTFDGLVTTPAWRGLARGLVGIGFPPTLLYPLGLLTGVALVYSSFRLAVRWSRRAAGTYLAVDELARQFAPSLVAIAAGYHLAHYLGLVVAVAPALAAVVTEPLSPGASASMVAPPSWIDFVAMAAVLAGHLVAIWVAHATAFRLFPGRLQAIRSQVPLVAVMVAYTTASLWIVAQPAVPVPYT